MYRLFRAKGVLAAACTFFLSFSFSLSGYSFDRFAMDLFRHEISGDTLNLHYTVTDPDAYKLKEGAPSLGSFDPSIREEELDYLEKCQKKLEGYQKKKLSEDRQLTAEIMDWWLSGQLLAEEYYYYQEPLGPTLGIQAQLPVLLAEFPFRKQGDIDTYLELLSTLPEYFKEIADFERQKSEQGLFMNDEILDKVLAQCRAFFPVNESHFLATTFQERLNNCAFLSSDQKIAYEAENLRNLNRYLQPAYEELCLALEELRGTGTNAYGLYHTPDGIGYYEYLLKYSIGTDLGMAEIHRLLDSQMEDDYETILYSIHEGIRLLDEEAHSPSEAPEEILERLQTQIQEDFPVAQDISWQVKEVPESLAAYLSPAFYMTPAIDAPQQNTIYINPSYELNQSELVTTLAHEGYPGHLYQNAFENTEGYAPVRNLFYVGGYTEGWGMYSEFYAYDLLGLSEQESSFLRAMSSLNYAVCASLDLAIHTEGWTEDECTAYLASFGITDTEQIHHLYLNILEEPSNYLKYYLGCLEIERLKESALALSPDLTLYDFHKWFLETGPAPFSILKEHLDTLKISSQLLQSAGEDLQLLACESVHDRLNHLSVKPRMFLIGCHSLICQGQQHHPFVFCAADTGYISLFHQIIDRSGQGSHRDRHSFRHCGHVLWLFHPNGIDDMHVVDGYLLKTSGDQRLMLHIQNLVKQHHQQIVEKSLLFQTISPPHGNLYSIT